MQDAHLLGRKHYPLPRGANGSPSSGVRASKIQGGVRPPLPRVASSQKPVPEANVPVPDASAGPTPLLELIILFIASNLDNNKFNYPRQPEVNNLRSEAGHGVPRNSFFLII